jgi:nucleotide-binding universal stress UspA family protein
MPIKTISLSVLIEDDQAPSAAIDYALSLAEFEKGHVSCTLATPILDLPSGHLLPMVHALVDQVNSERLAKAMEVERKIEVSVRLSGLSFDCRIVQKPYFEMRGDIVTAGRTSDVIVISQPNGSISPLSLSSGLVEAVLFESGRPVIVVPESWSKGARFQKIVVGWDGGAQSARAIGDALPFIARATHVEIICAVSEGTKSLVGAGLARHLDRHCLNVKLTELPIQYADAGRTLLEHVENVKADLFVLGAYGHSRLMQFLLGGVTQTMLTEATFPILFSH